MKAKPAHWEKSTPHRHAHLQPERQVSVAIFEYSTKLRDCLWKRSCDFGEVYHAALLAGTQQTVEMNPDGEFSLYRIGDALVARNVHAAIYDAARIVKTL
jgi:hypothetical protein